MKQTEKSPYRGLAVVVDPPPAVCKLCEHCYDKYERASNWRCSAIARSEETSKYNPITGATKTRVKWYGIRRCIEVNKNGDCPDFIQRISFWSRLCKWLFGE
jgi:hypothetical protein